MANDHLPEKQVLSSNGLCADTLQVIMFSRAYGAAFKYTVFDCPSTPSNPLFPLVRNLPLICQIHAGSDSQILLPRNGGIGYSVCVGRDRYPNAGEPSSTSTMPEQSSLNGGFTDRRKEKPPRHRAARSSPGPGLHRVAYCSVTST
jgi:hypothetical protein